MLTAAVVTVIGLGWLLYRNGGKAPSRPQASQFISAVLIGGLLLAAAVMIMVRAAQDL